MYIIVMLVVAYFYFLFFIFIHAKFDAHEITISYYRERMSIC
jgi:hypothetical protein